MLVASDFLFFLSPLDLHVCPSSGLPLHLFVRADSEGFHQCCCLSCDHLPAAKHAGAAAPSPHRKLLLLQGDQSFASWRLIRKRLLKSLVAGLCAQTLVSVMENLPHTNTAELIISLVSLAVLVPVKEINVRFRHRLRTPIPVEILTVSRQLSEAAEVH